MSYREKPATPNSPSGTSVTTMYDHLLSPASPAMEEEKDDRLRNDLLDEICNDMGIDDSMDLDFDDFVSSGNQQQPHSHGSLAAPHHKPHQHSHSAPYPAAEGSDMRKATTTASSYSSSDSLCAIAKLTQSISTDASNKTATQDAARPNMAASDHSSEDSPQSDQSKLNQLRLKAEAVKAEIESPDVQPKSQPASWNTSNTPTWQTGAPAAPQARSVYCHIIISKSESPLVCLYRKCSNKL